MKNNKFIITCQARTGSTMLCTALQNHPELCTHGEVLQGRQFNPSRMDDRLEFQGLNYYKQQGSIFDYLRNQLVTDQVRYIDEMIFYNGRYKRSGFKFKYEELSSKLFTPAREYIRQHTDIKVIHLYRLNLWERFVSEYIATKVTNKFNIRDKDHISVSAEDKFSLDVTLVESAMEKSKRWYKEYADFFANHDVYSLTYEKIKSNPQGEFDQVTKFLGVDSVNWSPATKKLKYPSYENLISNYSEIADHFKGTEYEIFFKKKAVTSTASDNCS